MKRIVTSIAAAMVVLSFAPGLQADDSQSPYSGIAKRNMFGLVSPPPPTIQVQDPAPTPEIKVCGFVSVFDKPLVLFRVAGIPEPGKTVRETTHAWEAGQHEGGVALLNIQDEGKQFVFDNHGTVQTIGLGPPAPPWKPPEEDSTVIGPIPEHWGSYVLQERRNRPEPAPPQ